MVVFPPVPSTRAPLPEEVLRKLRTHRLFAQLSDEEFRQVTALLRVRTLKEGEILFSVGDHDTNLYVVRQGKLLIRVPEYQGQDPVIGKALPGDVLNELAFVTGRADEITVEAATEARLWYIPRAEFQTLLRRAPALAQRIAYPSEAAEYGARRRRMKPEANERVLWFGRRHWSYLLGRIASVPLLVLLAGVLLALALTQQIVLPQGVLLALTVVLFGIALLVLVWELIDYLNDYYAVTDQRVIHRERVVLLYDQQDEVPLNRVQRVEVIRTGLVDSLLDIGTVFIETQGALANIEMDYVSQPDYVSKLITDEAARVSRESHAQQRSQVRAELRVALGITKPPEPQSSGADAPKPPLLRQRIQQVTAQARAELLPYVRVERGAEIVYRRHWLYLLFNVARPLGLILLTLGALIAAPILLPSLTSFLFQMPFVLVPAVLLLAFALWFIWQYEDWRNDIYVITRDRVIDSKRSPFGVRGMTQRTASLESIQNVTATTRGLIDTLFNMGDVSIRTGGVENELLFARVWNPRQVQRDIYKRMADFAAAKQAEEAARRRRELVEGLGIYDELVRIHRNRELI
ncbi:MAG: cyclic nucleotide-binding domain-containing protein [Thermoflexales bacterium]|nr:cyclic nucleotide-binding domain-containing protein [Thermoflexales bacterium]